VSRCAFALLFMLVLLTAAAPTFRWSLPAGVREPVVPADNRMSDAKVALGRRLFYDADLSIDGTMACSTCHEQHRGFADGNVTHAGVHGDPGRRNVPGLANVAWRRALTWGDPRVTTLEAQVAIPLTGSAPVEMGMAGQERELSRRLNQDACYRRMFSAAFPETRGRIDAVTVSRALAAFQRTLLSFQAPVDRGLAPAAGAAIFTAQCASCHSGHDYTDDHFHRLRSSNATDRGLSEVTGIPADDGAFRTPSLRNVAVTGPWLHDGSAATLAAAIQAHPGSDPADIPALIAFLQALTDQEFLTDPRFSYPDGICSR
jgi:cytochrome c peroxidase